jgi:hypothetical protein
VQFLELALDDRRAIRPRTLDRRGVELDAKRLPARVAREGKELTPGAAHVAKTSRTGPGGDLLKAPAEEDVLSWSNVGEMGAEVVFVAVLSVNRRSRLGMREHDRALAALPQQQGSFPADAATRPTPASGTDTVDVRYADSDLALTSSFA